MKEVAPSGEKQTSRAKRRFNTGSQYSQERKYTQFKQYHRLPPNSNLRRDHRAEESRPCRLKELNLDQNQAEGVKVGRPLQTWVAGWYARTATILVPRTTNLRWAMKFSSTFRSMALNDRRS
jgi:hypothetical protein